ncbi:MAG: hypothetical protein Ta2B_28630 [Termitinemataceae bacterium]|nr:MAG: hypothetical protein Ta2B_28630 [Termitinemataceae bacterium]
MKKLILIASFIFAAALVFGQDGFGFGDDASASTTSNGGGSNVDVSGKVSASVFLYPGDSDFGAQNVGDIFSGRLSFKSRGDSAEAAINIKLDKLNYGISSYRDVIDEAYVNLFLGGFYLEGGLRKLTWGKADSFGPNDLVNYTDYRDLRDISNPQNMKQSVPLLHASYYFGDSASSKMEIVFVPYFEGDVFSKGGRWIPALVKNMPDILMNDVQKYIIQNYPANAAAILAGLTAMMDSVSLDPPTTTGIENFQGGARFTTTINGAIDIGVQYYYGHFRRPSVMINGIEKFGESSVALNINYNPYHSVGFDMAFVLAGFNLRAEAAAFLTEDTDGKKRAVENPRLAWSLGFDRDLFAGINANIQCNETIILFSDEIIDNRALDSDAGSDITSTRITAKLSKKLLQDKIELSAAAVWGIEAGDCVIVPAIKYNKGDMSTELSGGIFAGNSDGELGSYKDNSYVKFAIGYSF